MKRKTVKLFAALAAAAVMMCGTITVSAEESYTTKSGDNLQKIARNFYGDAGKWNLIYEANKDQIKNPNKIWANQTLILPDAESRNSDTSDDSTDTSTSMSDEAANTSSSDATADASSFLQNVYNLMAAQNYGAMRAVDGSDEAAAYVNSMNSDRAVYIPDGSLTGKGAGIYKVDSGYYFYYGDYVNGIRCGSGSSFISAGDGLEIYTGAWNDDAPNGQGAVTTILDAGEKYIYSGTMLNGLWNGIVNIEYTNYFEGNVYWSYDNIAFVADNGVATADKTNEYLSHIRWLWEEYDYTMENFLWEGRIVYAFGGESNGNQIDGVEQYYDDARVAFYSIPGSRLGVFGWAD